MPAFDASAGAPDPARDRARRLDPMMVLEADPLAMRLLDAQHSGRSGALADIRSRDPRARLEAASAALHGPAEFPRALPEEESAGGPGTRLDKRPRNLGL